MFDEEFRVYDMDTPEVRGMQRALPTETFALAEGLMARWQRAGMPLKPSRRGFAFQAPHGDRLTTIACQIASKRLGTISLGGAIAKSSLARSPRPGKVSR